MKKALITLVILITVMIGIIIIGNNMPQKTPGTVVDSQAEVSSTVTDFGKQLQLVSLLAPKDVLMQSMQTYYGSYISQPLLAQWENDPTHALGRLTSSPWPDHIDIVSITKIDEDTYAVVGNIVEITSNEIEHGGVADEYSVQLTIQNINGTWLITQVQK